MTLGAGQTLLHYRLVDKLGEGGMGVVWRAVDTTLGREVAVKILPEGFAQDAGRRARFEREARLLASLNHVNIATLHGLHTWQPDTGPPTHFLTMELVQGEDLAARLARSAMSLEESLDCALQIARALEAAHERDIVHRDLKPANVLLTGDGKVKVLDFGLAKALRPEVSGADVSMAPTETWGGTRTGEVLGTASHMSPEQARGLPLDKRTDIWSFGCVLFEMLAGKSPFRRATVPDTLAAVLEREPDWSLLPAAVPLSITKLMRRCLVKRPEHRLRDIGDAALEIEDALAGGPREAVLPGPAASRRGLPYWVVALLVVLGIVGGAVLAPRRDPARPTSDGEPTRLVAPLPASVVIGVGPRPALALSPDGRWLAFAGRTGDAQQIYVRSLGADHAVAIPDTLGADSPFFSADSRWVGLLNGNWLLRAPSGGGAPVRMFQIPPVSRGFDWADPNAIIVSQNKVLGLTRVATVGDGPRAWEPRDGWQSSSILSRPDAAAGEINHCWPQTLPGGRRILATSLRRDAASYDDADIVVIDPETGRANEVVKGGYYGRLIGDGILAFVRGGRLWAVSVEQATLKPTGPPVAVLDGFLTDPATGSASYAVSEDGTLAYLAGGVHEWLRGRLVWVDRQGNVAPVSDEVRSFRSPRVSPDDGRIVCTIEEASDDVWIFEPDRGGFSRLTFENRDIAPIWRPGHDELSFSVVGDVGESPQLHVMPADGSARPRLLVSGVPTAFNTAWSADGDTLLFMQYSTETGMDVFVVGDGGAGRPVAFLESRFDEMMPAFSPDGNWIAYASDESGRPEVYVQRWPGPGGKRQVSTDGGMEPVWNPRGGELFYRSGDRLMAVRVQTGREFRAARAEVLFEDQFARHPLKWLTNYDVSRDGQRFLMIQETDRPEIREIQVILHWIEEVRQALVKAEG